MKRVLIIVENLPSPFDRRVWQEATTLVEHGYQVSIICPTGEGCEAFFEVIQDVHIYRYRLPIEAEGLKGYIVEYSFALWHSFRLAWKVKKARGIDIIHACNPPDLLFLVGGLFKLLYGIKFVFDHHDINPELYEAKFGRKGLMWKLMVWLERCSFKTADISIATNESYKKIAIERGQMDESDVFVVRSGPKLERMRQIAPVPSWKHGKTYMVGYVGVMGKQEGIDLLLLSIQYIVNEMKRKDIHFTLVGGGTSLEEMKGFCHSLNLDDYVTFTGRVSDQALLEVLNTADVCVNPDVANEMNDKSTMNKIMEYMALAKPIVQFDLVEGRFSAQQASLYAKKNDIVDFARLIVQLMDDEALRNQMGALAEERVKTVLQWSHEVPKLLAAYSRLDG